MSSLDKVVVVVVVVVIVEDDDVGQQLAKMVLSYAQFLYFSG